jgi:hypothetical protein
MDSDEVTMTSLWSHYGVTMESLWGQQVDSSKFKGSKVQSSHKKTIFLKMVALVCVALLFCFKLKAVFGSESFLCPDGIIIKPAKFHLAFVHFFLDLKLVC